MKGNSKQLQICTKDGFLPLQMWKWNGGPDKGTFTMSIQLQSQKGLLILDTSHYDCGDDFQIFYIDISPVYSLAVFNPYGDKKNYEHIFSCFSKNLITVRKDCLMDVVQEELNFLTDIHKA